VPVTIVAIQGKDDFAIYRDNIIAIPPTASNGTFSWIGDDLVPIVTALIGATGALIAAALASGKRRRTHKGSTAGPTAPP
jgi:hypothetical protein